MDQFPSISSISSTPSPHFPHETKRIIIANQSGFSLDMHREHCKYMLDVLSAKLPEKPRNKRGKEGKYRGSGKVRKSARGGEGKMQTVVVKKQEEVREDVRHVTEPLSLLPEQTETSDLSPPDSPLQTQTFTSPSPRLLAYLQQPLVSPRVISPLPKPLKQHKSAICYPSPSFPKPTITRKTLGVSFDPHLRKHKLRDLKSPYHPKPTPIAD